MKEIPKEKERTTEYEKTFNTRESIFGSPCVTTTCL